MTEVNVSATVGMSMAVGEMSATVGEMSATVGNVRNSGGNIRNSGEHVLGNLKVEISIDDYA